MYDSNIYLRLNNNIYKKENICLKILGFAIQFVKIILNGLVSSTIQVFGPSFGSKWANTIIEKNHNLGNWIILSAEKLAFKKYKGNCN